MANTDVLNNKCIQIFTSLGIHPDHLTSSSRLFDAFGMIIRNSKVWHLLSGTTGLTEIPLQLATENIWLTIKGKVTLKYSIWIAKFRLSISQILRKWWSLGQKQTKTSRGTPTLPNLTELWNTYYRVSQQVLDWFREKKLSLKMFWVLSSAGNPG